MNYYLERDSSLKLGVAFGVVVTAAAKNKLTGIASFFFGDWVSRRNGPQFSLSVEVEGHDFCW
jgi:hypothetical protein